MLNIDTLSVNWSLIDGEGIVRVVPVKDYSTGFVLMAHIGKCADQMQYYPKVTLEQSKVTIVVSDEDEQKAIQIASSIDAILA